MERIRKANMVCGMSISLFIVTLLSLLLLFYVLGSAGMFKGVMAIDTAGSFVIQTILCLSNCCCRNYCHIAMTTIFQMNGVRLKILYSYYNYTKYSCHSCLYLYCCFSAALVIVVMMVIAAVQMSFLFSLDQYL